MTGKLVRWGGVGLRFAGQSKEKGSADRPLLGGGQDVSKTLVGWRRRRRRTLRRRGKKEERER